MTQKTAILVIASLLFLTSRARAQQKPSLDCCKVPTRLAPKKVASPPQRPTSNTHCALRPAPSEMAWIPGGEFVMGANDSEGRADESPRHRVRVSGFWMDITTVTNADFAKFIATTGYVTTAERKPEWEEIKKQLPAGTPEPADAELVPGSMVFTPPDQPVSLKEEAAWWQFVPGANWRHPEGAGSDLKGRENHPVVQVSYEDSLAYCKWAGKRLPTEAEWEFAARGGRKGQKYFWGDSPVTPKKANYWQGHFPDDNTAQDGFLATAPVKSFPANGYGLYDMAGNVWQWCADWYRADAYRQQEKRGLIVDPIGPAVSFDPDEPTVPKRVQRGGSFLCNEAYCASYRVAARMKSSPDTSLNHVGFRCVMSPNVIPETTVMVK